MEMCKLRSETCYFNLEMLIARLIESLKCVFTRTYIIYIIPVKMFPRQSPSKFSINSRQEHFAERDLIDMGLANK